MIGQSQRPVQVQLTIGEFVAHGFSPAAARRMADAMERELTRLITDGGVAALSRNDSLDLQVEQVDGGAIAATSRNGATPAAIGIGIARMLYGRLTE